MTKFEKSRLKNNRFFFLIKYIYIPNAFIQIVPSSHGLLQDPHLHYYKLLQFIKNQDGRLKLYFLAIDNLSDDQKKTLKDVLHLQSENDIYKLSFILADKNGNYKQVFKGNENLESSKRFLKGIRKVDSLDQLNVFINKSADEAIHIISSGHKTFANNIVNKFFENSSLFSESTFNFINYYPNFFNMLSEGRLINKNEILILFNPKFYNLESLEECKDLLVYDLKERKLVNYSEFKINEKNENFLFAYKYKIADDNKENFNKEIEIFIDFIQGLIDPNSIGNNVTLPKRFYLTNNMDIANYYKLKFVNEKSKTLFVYINAFNLSKMNIDPESLSNTFLNIINKSLQHFEENSKFNYILTFNPNVAKTFNIYPKSNENLSIRFVDYGLIVNYDSKLNGQFSFIDLNKEFDLNNYNKNLLFYYKSTYNKKSINEDEFCDTIKEFTNSNNKDFLKSHPNILEFLNLSLNPDSNLNMVNGADFKNKFLDIPGKKLLLCVSDNCIGCPTIKQILENETSELNHKIKIFLYDVMNETIHFKKIKKVPLIVLYDGNKIIKELEVNQHLNNSNASYEEAVSDVVKNLIKNYF